MASVKVEQGLLRGGKSKTDNGFEYYEFLEIPYAKPPVGELRFLVCNIIYLNLCLFNNKL